jgi:PAS domain S-box-containing protein
MKFRPDGGFCFFSALWGSSVAAERRKDRDRRVAKSKRELVERLKAQGTLNEPWEQLISIFDAIDEKVYVSDPNTHEILYANPAKKSLFGEHIVGQKCYRVFQGLDEPCDFCTNHLILGENLGKTQIWEFQNRKTGGWVRCIDRAIRWSDGRMVRFEMAIDIHDRKVAEEALQESERKYRQLVENIREVIYSTDAIGAITYVSPAVERLTGYTPSEMEGRHFSEFIFGDDVEYLVSRYGNALSGQERPAEYRILTKSGGYRWVRTFTASVREGDEQIGLQGVLSDITEYRDALAALQESEGRHRELLETMNEGFVIVDENEIAIYVNRRFAEMLGYEAGELFGKPASMILDESNAQKFREKFAKRRQGDSATYEMNLEGKNGQRVVALVAPKPVFGKDGSFKGSFATVTDVTELKKTEDELREREKELSSKTSHLEEMNAALRVLLEKREMDKGDLEEKVLLNVKQLITPFIEKLKRVVDGMKQKAYLDVIEENLRSITSDFSRDLHFRYQNLTPTESQIAGLIRDGRTSKEIAGLMNLSDRTIESHRKNLRKKMGLKDKKVNLRTTLLTIK